MWRTHPSQREAPESQMWDRRSCDWQRVDDAKSGDCVGNTLYRTFPNSYMGWLWVSYYLPAKLTLPISAFLFLRLLSGDVFGSVFHPL